MDIETKALVQRWILAFCETPVLIDAELMRRVIADVGAEREYIGRSDRIGVKSAYGPGAPRKV